jgi:hypothetical protein
MTTINLEDHRTEGAKVFTGRDRGKKVREDSKIESSEENYDKVVIIVPKDIYSINPSFLEEFLRPVVKKLGKHKFYRKIEFQCQGPYDIKTDLDEAVDRILRENHALV